MWFGPPERNTLRPRENVVVLLKPGLARVSLNLFFFPTTKNWHLPESFIAQGRAATTSPKARQVAWGQVKPYDVEHHRPEVTNNVFNGVGTSGLVTCLTAHGQKCGGVLLCRWAL
jgi:hypothetical protein